MDEKIVINGYRLLTPLTNENAGFCKWAEAVREGENPETAPHYFIKQFLAPIQPDINARISTGMRRQKEEACLEFQKMKSSLYAAIKRADRGNIVGIQDFFCWENHYYIITEFINQESISVDSIKNLPLEKKLLLMKVLSNAVAGLANEKIIHGDIKPNNILIKKTIADFYTLKLIDFDSSYFEGPVMENRDEIQGDPVYLAPETCLCVMEELDELTTQADVFSLGIIFYQYFCGSLPRFAEEYDYVYEAVLDDADLELDRSIPEEYRVLISCMLRKDPLRRPTMKAVLDYLNGMRPLGISTFRGGANPPPVSKPKPADTGKLKGSLLNIIENER